MHLYLVDEQWCVVLRVCGVWILFVRTMRRLAAGAGGAVEELTRLIAIIPAVKVVSHPPLTHLHPGSSTSSPICRVYVYLCASVYVVQEHICL